MTSTDRIEKQITMKAPRSRVWRALTDAGEFGKWFGFKTEGQFGVGKTVVIRHPKEGWEHFVLDLIVERMDPETHFSYRWHPFPGDPKVNYSSEPMTLVEFRLEEQAGGTLLTVVESGFDRLTTARREEVFPMHTKGWIEQLEKVRKYVDA